jgi:hypothetical protein
VNRDFSIGKLRKTAERLKQIPWDTTSNYNRLVAPQEILDFLAMLGGLKPVYALGRGFDDPQWIRGIRELSVDLGLFVLDGMPWEPPEAEGPLPLWYREYLRRLKLGRVVSYVARLEPVAEEVLPLTQSGLVTEADEARLLGYPECCVRAYHATLRAISLAEYQIALRDSGGDPERLRARLNDGFVIEARDEPEAQALEPNWVLAPFTSVFLCEPCQASPDSPGKHLSARMSRFLAKIDPWLHGILIRIVAESPAYGAKNPG